ncbi:hypothetical protein BDAP_001614 [Binucleata daphniae]
MELQGVDNNNYSIYTPMSTWESQNVILTIEALEDKSNTVEDSMSSLSEVEDSITTPSESQVPLTPLSESQVLLTTIPVKNDEQNIRVNKTLREKIIDTIKKDYYRCQENEKNVTYEYYAVFHFCLLFEIAQLYFLYDNLQPKYPNIMNFYAMIFVTLVTFVVLLIEIFKRLCTKKSMHKRFIYFYLLKIAISWIIFTNFAIFSIHFLSEKNILPNQITNKT